jgi:D-alanyl-D-alanine carboxypeptidase
MPTRGRTARLLAALAVPVAALVPFAAASPVAAARTTVTRRATTTTAAPAPLLPKSWILVDADTGRVLDAHDEHTRRRPASTVKLLSVLTATQHLSPSSEVTVSPLAAGMPARKIGLPAGATWPLDDIVSSMLVVSANDAAVALAEASGSTLDGFAAQQRATVAALGLVDAPVVDDPAGLDDAQFAHGRGDWISAWDMAVIGRAALRDARIRSLAAMPIVRFTDPDGHPHRLINHNKLLSLYPGATGLKTGYTKAAGNTLVASATRNGRTMLAVVLDAPNLYAPVEALFDKGFGTDARAEQGPLLTSHELAVGAGRDAARTVRSLVAPKHEARSSTVGRDVGEWGALAVAGAALLFVEARRRRRGMRRR